MKKPPYETPYCLHCYIPLHDVEGASTHCPQCGRANLTIDLQRLWTREKRIGDIEDLLKILIVIGVSAISIAALLHPGVGMSGRGHGMAAGAPILLGILLWDVTSITKKTSLFRGSLIWPIVGAIGLLISGPIFWTNGELLVRVVSGAIVAASIAGILSPFTRKRWLAWRVQHVLARQRALGIEPKNGAVLGS